MSETLVPNLTGQDLLDAQIYNLAERTREYDALLPERTTLKDTWATYYEALLQGVDIDLEPDEQPQELAIAALGLYITEIKQKELQESLDGLDSRTRYHGDTDFYNRKIEVVSLDPERRKMGTSKINEYGQQEGLGKFYTHRVGRVGGIMLDASDGGTLRIRGRNGKSYYANPLIDAAADYTPAFKLTLQ